MRSSDRGEELAELVLRRGDVLELLEGSRLDKPALVEQLSVSRSTIDRAIRELETHSLVRREQGGYTVTLAGRLAYEAVERFSEEIEDVARTAELLVELPLDIDFPVELLDGAEVHTPALPATYEPIEIIDRLFEESERAFAALETLTSPRTPEMAAKRILEGSLEYEVIYQADLAAFLRENRNEERRQMAATGQYTAYELEALPLSFARFERDGDTRVVIHAFGDDGKLLGVLVNDSETAVAWAESMYEQLRDRATEITDTFGDGTNDGADVPDDPN
jgi:predicted transcriptional regulator